MVCLRILSKFRLLFILEVLSLSSSICVGAHSVVKYASVNRIISLQADLIYYYKYSEGFQKYIESLREQIHLTSQDRAFLNRLLHTDEEQILNILSQYGDTPSPDVLIYLTEYFFKKHFKSQHFMNSSMMKVMLYQSPLSLCYLFYTLDKIHKELPPLQEAVHDFDNFKDVIEFMQGLLLRFSIIRNLEIPIKKHPQNIQPLYNLLSHLLKEKDALDFLKKFNALMKHDHWFKTWFLEGIHLDDFNQRDVLIFILFRIFGHFNSRANSSVTPQDIFIIHRYLEVEAFETTYFMNNSLELMNLSVLRKD
jgi:hypothetical protein